MTGHVEDYLEKRAAEKAAARVKGVAEEIKVELHSSMRRTDEEIAKAAVDSGFVTLTGQI